jgi:cytochrome c
MKIQPRVGTALVSAFVLGVLSYAGGAAAQNGQALYTSKGCPACHGADGKKTLVPTYPTLAGQNDQYLVLQLKAFKTQERKGGQAALMVGMAAQLSDEEMQKISEYLAKLK